MAIEFRCSQCTQLLRVPETAAGKSARCPKCQALMTVPSAVAIVQSKAEPPPATNPPTSTSPPGFGSPLPTSTPAPTPSFSDPFAHVQSPPPKPAPDNPFGSGTFPNPSSAPSKPALDSPFAPSAAAPQGAEINPYASPAAGAYTYTPHYYPSGQRPGLPWDVERRTIGCWFRTMAMVVGSPSQAFSVMHQYGGLGTPMLFNTYAIGMLFGLLAAIAVPILILVAAFGGLNNVRGEAAAGIALVTGFIILYMLFVGVITVVVWPLIGAAILHLSLMIFQGARHGFETTFRVVCYTYFSILLPSMFLSLIPYLGGLAALIWMIVLYIIAIQKAHETTGGKAAGAVLAPIGVCCGLYIALIAVFVAGPNIFDALKR